MENDTTEQKPQKIVEGRVQVELLHPINHDDILYSRGLHELDESLARLFLSFKDPVSKKPIARESRAAQVTVARGTTRPTK